MKGEYVVHELPRYLWGHPLAGTEPTLVKQMEGSRSPTRWHPRPSYTMQEAQMVADWLNGRDQPLHSVVDRAHDLWDPSRR